MDQLHPLLGQEIAADPEGLQSRFELFQLAKDVRGVQIAGRLAGNDRELHRGNGNIAHPSAMPPKKRAMNTQMKKRMRSLFVLFQSSAKKADVQTA
jgi:hypothetical protein